MAVWYVAFHCLNNFAWISISIDWCEITSCSVFRWSSLLTVTSLMVSFSNKMALWSPQKSHHTVTIWRSIRPFCLLMLEGNSLQALANWIFAVGHRPDLSEPTQLVTNFSQYVILYSWGDIFSAVANFYWLHYIWHYQMFANKLFHHFLKKHCMKGYGKIQNNLILGDMSSQTIALVNISMKCIEWSRNDLGYKSLLLNSHIDILLKKKLWNAVNPNHH